MLHPTGVERERNSGEPGPFGKRRSQMSFESTRREFMLAAAAAGILRNSLRAQPPLDSEQATFSTGVKVVNTLASVRDKSGKLITDLTKDDFTLLEDGRPQAIRYFGRQSDLPLTIGLMIDTSMSQSKVMDAERGA